MNTYAQRERVGTTIDRIKLAELTSGVGALVLGVGMGTIFASRLAGRATAIILSGLALHAWGMWDRHRVEAHRGVPNPPWATALYWVCWLTLLAPLAYVLLFG